MKNKKTKIVITALLSLLAVFLFAACGNEYNGAGAGEISLVLDKVYDGVSVGCPEGEIETVTPYKEYRIKVRTRKRTDVVVSCEGYYTQTVIVNTKDFADGTAQKNITLEKRYNILTLNLVGVADMSGVTVESQNGMIRSQSIDGKKVTLSFKEYVGDGAIDELKIKCDGYHTYPLTVEKSFFTDYSASMKVTLLSTSSDNASVTFINDLGGGGYSLEIKKAAYTLDANSTTYVNVKTSATQILDKNSNYYITARNRYGFDEEYYTPIAIKGGETPYLTVSLSGIKGIEYCKNDDSITRRYSITVPSELRQENVYTDMFTSDGSRIEFDTHAGIIYSGNVKGGDTVRVVSYFQDNYGGCKLISCYETEFTESSFTLEAGNIDENITVKFRFVDKNGEPKNLSDIPDRSVMLFNDYGVDGADRFFVNGDGYEYVYVDIAHESLGIAEKEDDGYLINVKKLFSLTIKQGEKQGESYFADGRSLYIRKPSENEYNRYETIEIRRLFDEALSGRPYDIKLPAPLKFKLNFYKYDADASAPKQYLTDLSVSQPDGNGQYEDATYNAQEGGYIVETTQVKQYYLSVYSDGKRYESLKFLASEELYEKQGEYLIIDVPVYEVKQLRIADIKGVVPMGDPKPDGSATFEGNLYIHVYTSYDENYPSDIYLCLGSVNETLIGQKFKITVSEWNNRGVRYEASGTLTRQNFDSGILELNFARIEENNNTKPV